MLTVLSLKSFLNMFIQPVYTILNMITAVLVNSGYTS